MSQEQRELLLTGMRLYLNDLWTRVAPSSERNHTIRVLQALKGKLLEHFSPSPLPLSMEEQKIVTEMLQALIHNAGNVPELSAAEQRAGLQRLKTHVEWSGSV